jgi:hypothetical protein
MQAAAINWAPFIAVIATVLMGILAAALFGNSRITDLRSDLNARFAEQNARIGREIDTTREFARSDSKHLEGVIRSEVKRLEDKIDRIASPIARA